METIELEPWSTTYEDMLYRHFTAVSVRHWEHTNCGERMEGMDVMDWLRIQVRKAAQNGVERGLAEVLGKHEPWPHHLLPERSFPWRI